jgi:hypothetical protein
MKGHRMLGESDYQSNWRDCLHRRGGIPAVLLARVSQGRSPKPSIIDFADLFAFAARRRHLCCIYLHPTLHVW